MNCIVCTTSSTGNYFKENKTSPIGGIEYTPIQLPQWGFLYKTAALKQFRQNLSHLFGRGTDGKNLSILVH